MLLDDTRINVTILPEHLCLQDCRLTALANMDVVNLQRERADWPKPEGGGLPACQAPDGPKGSPQPRQTAWDGATDSPEAGGLAKGALPMT